jgi:hypothetical protein
VETGELEEDIDKDVLLLDNPDKMDTSKRGKEMNIYTR